MCGAHSLVRDQTQNQVIASMMMSVLGELQHIKGTPGFGGLEDFIEDM